MELKVIVKNSPSEERQKELIKEITGWIQINYYSQKGDEKMSAETQEMFTIIHQNNKRVREFNKERAKKQKRQVIIDSVIMFLASSIFMIGIMTFIAMIERLRF